MNSTHVFARMQASSRANGCLWRMRAAVRGAPSSPYICRLSLKPWTSSMAEQIPTTSSRSCATLTQKLVLAAEQIVMPASRACTCAQYCALQVPSAPLVTSYSIILDDPLHSVRTYPECAALVWAGICACATMTIPIACGGQTAMKRRASVCTLRRPRPASASPAAGRPSWQPGHRAPLPCSHHCANRWSGFWQSADVCPLCRPSLAFFANLPSEVQKSKLRTEANL